MCACFSCMTRHRTFMIIYTPERSTIYPPDLCPLKSVSCFGVSCKFFLRVLRSPQLALSTDEAVDLFRYPTATSRGVTMLRFAGLAEPSMYGQSDGAYPPEGEENSGHTSLTGENLKRFCKSMNVPEEEVRRLVYIHDVHKLDSKSEAMEKAAGGAAQDSVEDVCNDFTLSEREARLLVELHDLAKIYSHLQYENLMKDHGSRPAEPEEVHEAALRLFHLGRDAHPHAEIHTDPLSEVKCKVYGPETSSTQIWESIQEAFSHKDLDKVALMVGEGKDGVTTWYAYSTPPSSESLLLKTYTVETRASLLYIAQAKGLPIQEVSFDFLTTHASASSGAYYGVDAGLKFVKADVGCFTASSGIGTGFGAGIKDPLLHIAQTKRLPIQHVSFDFLNTHASARSGGYCGVDAGVNIVKANVGCLTASAGLGAGVGAGIKDDSVKVQAGGLGFSVGRVMGFSIFGTGASIDFGKLF